MGNLRRHFPQSREALAPGQFAIGIGQLAGEAGYLCLELQVGVGQHLGRLAEQGESLSQLIIIAV
jgi:hypothetical protein